MLFIADFETTVNEDTVSQEETEVWAFGIARLFDGTENVKIGNNIGDFFNELKKGARRDKKICYFTNLKFDGSFILHYLTSELGFKAAYNENDKKYLSDKDMPYNSFSCVITDLGIWYCIVVNFEGYIIEFRDTLKLLPFSVKDLGPAFDTKYRKLEMEYKGNMKAYGEITPEQASYIRNDILVPKEALEKFLTEINKAKRPPLTIGQWAISEFKKYFTRQHWKDLFPNLAEIKLDKWSYGAETVDEYVRKAFMGGWCFADERYTGLINGTTKVYDVNSLYPSCMNDPNNLMPIGMPYMIEDVKELLKFGKNSYYFIRFKCSFKLKDGYFPFIQLKHDLNYRSNENLKTSKYDRFGNNLGDYRPEITLSGTLFNLFIQCYEVKDLEILDGCVFYALPGNELFGAYIDKFINMKIKAGKEGNKVKRQVAKLALNSLFGKFGRNPENCFKIPVFNEKFEVVDYVDAVGANNKPLFIPMAAAITSHARKFTVKAAIMNYNYTRYVDTDSLHLVCPEDYVPLGIKIDDSALSCWKEESVQKHSLFVRQKTYIEWTDQDYDIKACGMPDRCKMLFEENLRGNKPIKGNLVKDGKIIKLSKKEEAFLNVPRDISKFHNGFSVPGKLLPKIVKGGTVLQEVDFTIN